MPFLHPALRVQITEALALVDALRLTLPSQTASHHSEAAHRLFMLAVQHNFIQVRLLPPFLFLSLTFGYV